MKGIISLFVMTSFLIMCVGCGRNEDKDIVERYNETENIVDNQSEVSVSAGSNVSESPNHSIDGFFAPGGGIKTYTFNNGIVLTAKDVWIEKYEWHGEQHTWIAVSIEAENTGSEKNNIPDFHFYADDYTIKEDSMAYSTKDDYLHWETEYNSIEGGRKLLGVYYVLLDDYENYTCLECTIGDAVFIIRDVGYDDITRIIGENIEIASKHVGKWCMNQYIYSDLNVDKYYPVVLELKDNMTFTFDFVDSFMIRHYEGEWAEKTDRVVLKEVSGEELEFIISEEDGIEVLIWGNDLLMPEEYFESVGEANLFDEESYALFSEGNSVATNQAELQNAETSERIIYNPDEILTPINISDFEYYYQLLSFVENEDNYEAYIECRVRVTACNDGYLNGEFLERGGGILAFVYMEDYVGKKYESGDIMTLRAFFVGWNAEHLTLKLATNP